MSKRWTYQDDIYIRQYVEDVGRHNVARDLKRSADGISARIRVLKDHRVWDLLEDILDKEADYMLRMMGEPS